MGSILIWPATADKRPAVRAEENNWAGVPMNPKTHCHIMEWKIPKSPTFTVVTKSNMKTVTNQKPTD